MPGLLLAMPYTAVQFVALHQCKTAASRLGLEGGFNNIGASLLALLHQTSSIDQSGNLILICFPLVSSGPDGRLPSGVSFVSGAVAGAAATIASYPFDLLRTTLAAQGEPKVQLLHKSASVSLPIYQMSEEGGPLVYTGVRGHHRCSQGHTQAAWSDGALPRSRRDVGGNSALRSAAVWHI